jgi:amidohydrolase
MVSNSESTNEVLEAARSTITSTIDCADTELHRVNKALHENPELGYEEHFAHQTITDYLSSLGFNVKKHAYGFDTSFEAEYGSGGRLVIVCAEYDALPGIGHSCGHNLIATSSIATFIAAAEAMKKYNIEGRLRLLGTPAEEGGGGKAKLIDAGAFPRETAAAIMAHPLAAHQVFHKPGYYQGLAGLKLIASHKFKTEFRGKPAHAAGEPWNGVNALDAAVAAYSNVGLLRQQMEPDERVHGVIEAGGTVPNVITDYTRMNWNVRSPTIERADKLLIRVKNCIEAAALASGCKLEYITQVLPSYSLYGTSTDRVQITHILESSRKQNIVRVVCSRYGCSGHQSSSQSGKAHERLDGHGQCFAHHTQLPRRVCDSSEGRCVGA